MLIILELVNKENVMSDKSELQQRAEDVLLNLVNKAAEIGSAAFDEIPLVVQELLTWKFTESLLSFFSSCLLLFVSYKFTRWLWKEIDTLEALLVPLGGLNIVMYVVACPMFTIDWLQIWLAPRVYLLEYAASLVK
ncbi:hypothetical protein Barba19A_gp037 [Rheinheimera phage vB_RspM_Barba19A]|uniref:Uncharacterized protein n=2 Tax=Barbavirus barba19A TaxID=2734091 RepID=A0A4P8NF48_9CAUD|nr:hypothetical protein HOV47_gp037 [Rheinheimera phage vB_RspM_Barba19A]QCQ61877.1 hypothetical protein Barba19A_gp037 [Rheinheimera phage vB_RspM_Barba19A]QCQ64627.1 hypothetical protein Barba31A_gp037 [Rheinheimera phage vB_RspM_Barba31A]